MKRGLYVPCFGPFGDIAFTLECARLAEERRWDGFFLWDHLLFDDGLPFIDAWIALAAIATTTTSIAIGPMVTPLARRRPQKLAREVVTLDHLSKGRLILGIGLGTDWWREYSAFDDRATTDRERAELVDDGIDILRALFSGERINYEGRQLSVRDVQFLPTPHQNLLPIWTAALLPIKRGPLARAARAQGIMPVSTTGPITPDMIQDLRSSIESARRSTSNNNDSNYDICVVGDVADSAGFERAGATWLLQSLRASMSEKEILAIIGAGPG